MGSVISHEYVNLTLLVGSFDFFNSLVFWIAAMSMEYRVMKSMISSDFP